MTTVESHPNINDYCFDGIFWADDDSSDEYEYYQYVTSEIGKHKIAEERQREKWLKFEYPEDQSKEYDPTDGDVRGNYKEVDKNRKKTWHSKGATPAGNRWTKIEWWEKDERRKRRRNYAKKFIRILLKDPNKADKYYPGSSKQKDLKTLF